MTAGRTHLLPFSKFIRSFSKVLEQPDLRFIRYNAEDTFKDVDWWILELSERRVSAPRPLEDLDLWVDASTNWGLSVVIGNSCAAWRWTS